MEMDNLYLNKEKQLLFILNGMIFLYVVFLNMPQEQFIKF